MDTITDDRPYGREGRVFKAYRVLANITQRNLSVETGIPLSMIRDYEQGRSIPSPKRLIVIMSRLDIPASELSPAVASAEETAC